MTREDRVDGELARPLLRAEALYVSSNWIDLIGLPEPGVEWRVRDVVEADGGLTNARVCQLQERGLVRKVRKVDGVWVWETPVRTFNAVAHYGDVTVEELRDAAVSVDEGDGSEPVQVTLTDALWA